MTAIIVTAKTKLAIAPMNHLGSIIRIIGHRFFFTLILLLAGLEVNVAARVPIGPSSASGSTYNEEPAFVRKLDPILRMMIRIPREELGAFEKFVPFVSSRNDTAVGVIIEGMVSPGDIDRLGGTFRTQKNGIVTAEVPISSLVELASLSSVHLVECSLRVYQELDTGRSASQIGDLDNSQIQRYRNGEGFQGLTGRGTIVGIVDGGIDLFHPWFWKNVDPSSPLTRILAAADFKPTIPKIITSIDIQNSIISGNGASDWQGFVDPHGTHVASIAAGNGGIYGNPTSGLVGIAPEADILFGRPRALIEVIDAIRWMRGEADRSGKPLVINVSLGNMLGSHNGTSPFEREISTFAMQTPLVKSAGNAYRQRLHASGSIPRTGDTATISFQYHNREGNWRTDVNQDEQGYPKSVIVDIWMRSNARTTVTLGYDGQDILSTASDGFGIVQGWTQGSDRWNAQIDNKSWGRTLDTTSNFPHEPLGRSGDEVGGRRIVVMIWAGTKTTSFENWKIHLRAENTTGLGDFHAYTERDNNIGFENADERYTISKPGNARNVITVAAYATRTTFGDDSWWNPFAGSVVSGQITPYSSSGPIQWDWYQESDRKPDVAAPGHWIEAAQPARTFEDARSMNRGTIRLPGTSMATPFVTGTVLYYRTW